MLAAIRPFFDHSRHQLKVRNLDATLDVLAFQGEEALSEPFRYRIEFTSSQRDLPVDQLLGQDAAFSLYPSPMPLPIIGLSPPVNRPLRTLHGVLTG
ncbi:type VI secretion system tip protein VgrG, partial [Pseudomonas sp. BN606]|nr:type VI secretion system tip protein VgrG [Pseudomonas sp. BN606]MDH4654271.1 type VI secretion system tip protein VgrG [Pseudomonas sp. BN606]